MEIDGRHTAKNQSFILILNWIALELTVPCGDCEFSCDNPNSLCAGEDGLLSLFFGGPHLFDLTSRCELADFLFALITSNTQRLKARSKTA